MTPALARTKPKLSAAAKLQLAEQTRATFHALLRRAKIPIPLHEFQVTPDRKWAFDYAWPTHRLALEVDGGIWTAGRHTRGAGWLKDTEKLNAAAVLGWRLLRCTPDQLCDLQLIATIQLALSSPLTP